MKGLILKDLYNLARTLRMMLVMLLVMGVFFAQNGVAFLSSYLIVMCSMLVVTTMSYDDLAKWDNFALTLPLSRRDIVLGKYGTMLALNLFGAAFSIAIGLPILYFSNSMGILELLLTAGASLLVGFLYSSICIPLLYKFGTEKARLMMIVLIMVPTFGVVSLIRWFPNLFSWVSLFTPLTFALAAIALTALVVAGSIWLSIRIYSKKEF